MIPIHETADSASFAVRVHPRAKKSAITGELGDALKIALTAPPIDGRANDACIEFFAKQFHVPRSAVSIVSGETSRSTAQIDKRAVDATMNAIIRAAG